MNRRNLMLSAAGAMVLAAAPGLSARAAGDEQAIVDHALGTLRDLRTDKEFGNARQLLRRARGVLIAPRIFKAGFFIGGEGGQALLLTRSAKGWSNPAFYTVASASFGLQIGAQESEMIMFIMTDKALKALMEDNFKIGANAAIAVATLGSSVEGATTSNAGADIVVWASSSGAYAGISLNGTLVQPSREMASRYYGRPVSSSEIVTGRSVTNPGAAPLVRALSEL